MARVVRKKFYVCLHPLQSTVVSNSLQFFSSKEQRYVKNSPDFKNVDSLQEFQRRS